VVAVSGGEADEACAYESGGAHYADIVAEGWLMFTQFN
jgi:hypothetical protein